MHSNMQIQPMYFCILVHFLVPAVIEMALSRGLWNSLHHEKIVGNSNGLDTQNGGCPGTPILHHNFNWT